MEQSVQNLPQRITVSDMYDRLVEMITFESFLMFWVIYAFIIWITMILWVTMDVGTRSSNVLFQLMSILFVTILWPLGLFLYLIVRPSSGVSKKFLWEIEHNLSVLAHIVEDSKKWLLFCPGCSKQISHTSKVCVNCKENLQRKCDECEKVVLENWKVCPYCSHKISKKKKKKKK